MSRSKQAINLDIRPETLAVFVDDTGHPELKNEVVYGLGGCAILGSEYIQKISDPWREVRRKVTGSADTPLHAADFSTLYGHDKHNYETVNEFFQGHFYRLGTTYSSETIISDNIPYWTAMNAMLRLRINHILQSITCADVVIIFESSDRDNDAIKDAFQNVDLKNGKRSIPAECYFMDKSLNEPGLEVADFVVNPIGGFIRQKVENSNRRLLDFDAVFLKAPNGYASFMGVETVKYTVEILPDEN